jgi:hypothetical protein
MTPEPATTTPEKPKLQTHEYIVGGLPMVLLAIGGALGGAIGGGAFALNISIFRNEMSPAKKYLLTTVVTIGAALTYLGAIIILTLLFPGLFKRR